MPQLLLFHFLCFTVPIFSFQRMSDCVAVQISTWIKYLYNRRDSNSLSYSLSKVRYRLTLLTLLTSVLFMFSFSSKARICNLISLTICFRYPIFSGSWIVQQRSHGKDLARAKGRIRWTPKGYVFHFHQINTCLPQIKLYIMVLTWNCI